MAPLVLTADQQTAAMKLGSAELKALFSRTLVPIDIQAQFFHSGVTTSSALSNFAASDTDLRQCLVDNFGVDSATSLAVRVHVGAVISAFQSALCRRIELSKLNGELDARQLQKPLLGSEYLVLKTAFELITGKQEDSDLPAKSYLEKRTADLESGDFRHEPLSSVLARDQDEDDSLVQSYDPNGQVRLRRSVNVVPLPANPEELRKRLTIMLNCLGMMALQHTNRDEIQGFPANFLQQYSGYLLGEHVWQMVARDNDGNSVATPHWGLVIQYELAIRKRAYVNMQETGDRLHLCIQRAWLDPLVKERAFTTPLAISSASGHRVNSTTAATVAKTALKDNGSAGRGRGAGRGKRGAGRGSGRGNDKGRGKGNNGGGKGNGSGLTIPAGCAARTPDGKPICFGYNDRAVRCRKPSCFEHVCGTCFGRHPMYSCQGQRNAPPAGETQGQGANV